MTLNTIELEINSTYYRYDTFTSHVSLYRISRGLQAVHGVWSQVRTEKEDQGHCGLGEEETQAHQAGRTLGFPVGQALSSRPFFH